MKVKPKCNHEETRLEHHHFLAIFKNRRQKNIWNANDVRFYALFVQCGPRSHIHSHIASTKKQSKYSATPYTPDYKQCGGRRQQNKKTKLKHLFFTHKRKAFSKNQLKRQPSKTCSFLNYLWLLKKPYFI